MSQKDMKMMSTQRRRRGIFVEPAAKNFQELSVRSGMVTVSSSLPQTQ
jgi:hypothetical protein